MRALGELRPDLILTNARALTMDPRRPAVQSVAVSGDRIVWTGADPDLPSPASAGARVIDCGGGTLLPGFHDAHMHFLAYVSSLESVDCGPGQVSSISDIRRLLAQRAARTPFGDWITAWGYDPFYLAERRHPTRLDLDAAAPHHPVRLNHRSGHACVLNSVAMDRVGIAEDTDEPSGATIARDLDTGSPNGLLLEMERFLDERVPRPSETSLKTSVERAARKLLSLGVTSVQDATHHNSVDRWNLFRHLSDQVEHMPRITLMPGADHITDFSEAGLHFAGGSDTLRVGHAKVMVTASSGATMPACTDLTATLDECISLGFPVAVHAVEADVVRSVAQVIAELAPLPTERPAHRIEHCSEAPPDVLESVIRCGAAVVTQPGFVHYQGDRYLAEVWPSMHPFLYRAASLAGVGVRVAFSSDAPVIDPNPMPAIHAAITRRTSSGRSLGNHEAVNLDSALRSYTLEPACMIGIDDHLGKLSPGSLADMALFTKDLMSIDSEELPSIRPVMTILGGRVVWES